jgi:quinolinate synthase
MACQCCCIKALSFSIWFNREAPIEAMRRNILFVPDQNLGAWVMERTGRKMDLWQGNCYVHVEFTARSINKIREEYPNAPVVAHPECTYAVRMLADEVCSTEKMVSFCRNRLRARSSS